MVSSEVAARAERYRIDKRSVEARSRRYLVQVIAADGRVTRFLVPNRYAWCAAKGIAKERPHSEVTLYGLYGEVVFRCNGTGTVFWGPLSTEPGVVQEFESNCTVCV